jgi:hypothetical protein
VFVPGQSLDAQIDSAVTKVVISDPGIPLAELIRMIDEQTPYDCVFSKSSIDDSRVLAITPGEYELSYLLEKIRSQTGTQIYQKQSRLIFVANIARDQPGPGVGTIAGFVRDGASMEVLPGAAIWLAPAGPGTYADAQGFFSLPLKDAPQDVVYIHFSYVGYGELVREFPDTFSLHSDFLLFRDASMEAVIISARLLESATIPDSIRGPGTVGINFLPGSLGGNDLYNELAFLPGINKGNDFQPGISIRGLPPSNTAYLLDGLPLYEPNHAFGLISAINPGAVSAVRLYKNYIPPEFSGRTSGVVQHLLKTGSSLEAMRTVTLSLEDISLRMEGPIVSQRTSYSAGTRKSLLGIYLPRWLEKNAALDDVGLNYWDADLKISHRLNPRNRLEIMGYLGRDDYLFQREADGYQLDNSFQWTNQLLGARWHGVAGNRLAHSLQFGMSRYWSDKGLRVRSGRPGAPVYYFDQIEQARLLDLLLNQRISYQAQNGLKLNAGVQFSRHKTSPVLYRSVISEMPPDQPVLETNTDTVSWDLSVYASLNWIPGKKIFIEPGLRVNAFLSQGGRSFFQFNPLLRTVLTTGRSSSLEIALQRNSQNIHLLDQQLVGMGSQLWFQANSSIPPHHLWQASIEFEQYLAGSISLEMSAYYRHLSGMVGFASPADLYDPSLGDGTVIPVFYDTENWTDRITRMDGAGWGLESQLSWTNNALDFFAGYAFGHTRLRMEENPDHFPASGDYRHSAHVFGQWRLTRYFLGYISWNYHSGGPYTLPVDAYSLGNGEWVLGFAGRNNQRYAPFHSVQLGGKYRGKLHGKPVGLDAGIRNALDRNNPVYVFLSYAGNKVEPRQVNGLPIHPYVRMSLQF